MLRQAMLQQVAGAGGSSTPLSGYVLNVNVPSVPFGELRGYYLTRQGMACVYPRFQEVSAWRTVHARSLTKPGSVRPSCMPFTEWSRLVMSVTYAVLRAFVLITDIGAHSLVPTHVRVMSRAGQHEYSTV